MTLDQALDCVDMGITVAMQREALPISDEAIQAIITNAITAMSMLRRAVGVLNDGAMPTGEDMHDAANEIARQGDYVVQTVNLGADFLASSNLTDEEGTPVEFDRVSLGYGMSIGMIALRFAELRKITATEETRP